MGDEFSALLYHCAEMERGSKNSMEHLERVLRDQYFVGMDVEYQLPVEIVVASGLRLVELMLLAVSSVLQLVPRAESASSFLGIVVCRLCRTTLAKSLRLCTPSQELICGVQTLLSNIIEVINVMISDSRPQHCVEKHVIHFAVLSASYVMLSVHNDPFGGFKTLMNSLSRVEDATWCPVVLEMIGCVCTATNDRGFDCGSIRRARLQGALRRDTAEMLQFFDSFLVQFETLDPELSVRCANILSNVVQLCSRSVATTVSEYFTIQPQFWCALIHSLLFRKILFGPLPWSHEMLDAVGSLLSATTLLSNEVSDVTGEPLVAIAGFAEKCLECPDVAYRRWGAILLGNLCEQFFVCVAHCFAEKGSGMPNVLQLIAESIFRGIDTVLSYLNTIDVKEIASFDAAGAFFDCLKAVAVQFQGVLLPPLVEEDDELIIHQVAEENARRAAARGQLKDLFENTFLNLALLICPRFWSVSAYLQEAVSAFEDSALMCEFCISSDSVQLPRFSMTTVDSQDGPIGQSCFVVLNEFAALVCQHDPWQFDVQRIVSEIDATVAAGEARSCECIWVLLLALTVKFSEEPVRQPLLSVPPDVVRRWASSVLAAPNMFSSSCIFSLGVFLDTVVAMFGEILDFHCLFGSAINGLTSLLSSPTHAKNSEKILAELKILHLLLRVTSMQWPASEVFSVISVCVQVTAMVSRCSLQGINRTMCSVQQAAFDVLASVNRQSAASELKEKLCLTFPSTVQNGDVYGPVLMWGLLAAIRCSPDQVESTVAPYWSTIVERLAKIQFQASDQLLPLVVECLRYSLFYSQNCISFLQPLNNCISSNAPIVAMLLPPFLDQRDVSFAFSPMVNHAITSSCDANPRSLGHFLHVGFCVGALVQACYPQSTMVVELPVVTLAITINFFIAVVGCISASLFNLTSSEIWEGVSRTVVSVLNAVTSLIQARNTDGSVVTGIDFIQHFNESAIPQLVEPVLQVVGKMSPRSDRWFSREEEEQDDCDDSLLSPIVNALANLFFGVKNCGDVDECSSGATSFIDACRRYACDQSQSGLQAPHAAVNRISIAHDFRGVVEGLLKLCKC